MDVNCEIILNRFQIISNNKSRQRHDNVVKQVLDQLILVCEEIIFRGFLRYLISKKNNIIPIEFYVIHIGKQQWGGGSELTGVGW